MRFTQHPSNNAVLGAPKNWDQSGELPCGALPVTQGEHDGMPVRISFWMPTAEEIQALQAGGMVRLWVYGAFHPAVAMDVEA